MLSTILGGFIIAHGAVHAILAAAPIPNDPSPKPGTFFTVSSRSWLLSRLGVPDAAALWIGILLVATATIIFILAGVGALGVSGLNATWRTMAVIAAAISLLLLVLFWHSWLIVGVLIDIALLIALLILNWPPQTLMN
jgi:hypothetical protein